MPASAHAAVFMNPGKIKFTGTSLRVPNALALRYRGQVPIPSVTRFIRVVPVQAEPFALPAMAEQVPER